MQYAKRHRRQAAGLCVYNGCPQPPTPAAGLCPEHHAAAKARTRQRRERFRAAGLCFQCGRRPPLHGYSVCWPCRVKHQESKEKAKLKAQAQSLALAYADAKTKKPAETGSANPVPPLDKSRPAGAE